MNKVKGIHLQSKGFKLYQKRSSIRKAGFIINLFLLLILVRREVFIYL